MDWRQRQCLKREVWQALPEDILEIVLSKIPFESLLRFRSVSKRWNSLLIPRAALRGQVSSKPALLYLCPEGGGLYLKRWLKFELFESRRKIWRDFDPRSFPRAKDLELLEIVASEGGLLCFLHESPSTLGSVHGFLVCNPLTGQYRLLHLPITYQSTMLVGLVVDSKTGHYKLVLAVIDDTTMNAQTTCVYDSLSCSWKKTTSDNTLLEHVMKRVSPCLPYRLSTGICFNGYLYFYHKFMSEGNSRLSHVVVRYDPCNEVWTKVQERLEVPYEFYFSPRVSRIAAENEEVLSIELNGLSRYELLHLRPTLIELISEELVDDLVDFLEENRDQEIREYDGYFDYYGFRDKDKFYHIIYLWTCDSITDEDEDDDDVWGMVRIVVHDKTKNRYRHFYQDEGLVNPFKVTNVWAFTPSLSAVV